MGAGADGSVADGRFKCAGCGKRTSVTAGTAFDRRRTPLTVWFTACWLFASQKDGISAQSLQRELEIGSYQTAWAMLHRLRRVLVRPGRERLTGAVEVDETYIVGLEPGLAGGRAKGKKVLVGIAVEILQPRGYGRCRMTILPDGSAAPAGAVRTLAPCFRESTGWRHWPSAGFWEPIKAPSRRRTWVSTWLSSSSGSTGAAHAAGGCYSTVSWNSASPMPPSDIATSSWTLSRNRSGPRRPAHEGIRPALTGLEPIIRGVPRSTQSGQMDSPMRLFKGFQSFQLPERNRLIWRANLAVRTLPPRSPCFIVFAGEP